MATTLDLRAGAHRVSGKIMCAFIADTIALVTGARPDPLALWHMSPTGEVWPVVALYERCRALRERDDRDGDGTAESS